MGEFKNREVVYVNKDWEICTTYFRGTDFLSIIPYFEKFKEDMVEIIAINNPDWRKKEDEPL